MAKGAGQKGINQESFYQMQIKIPTLDKQKEIVQYCDEIEHAIQVMEQRVKHNDTLMKTIMDNYLKDASKDDSKDIKKEDTKPATKSMAELYSSDSDDEFEWNETIINKMEKYIDDDDKLDKIMVKYDIPKKMFKDKIKELIK
jgi:restriction endonuclease S subunit